ncbi:hypothetical protein D3C71_349100 [compost metagenome]
MNKTIEESKCLASWAVFRELYNSKKDVYGIISEFIIEMIVTNSMHSFNLTEITTLLNKTYDFNILPAVVKSSLNKLSFLKKSDGLYIVENLSELKSNNLNIQKETIQASNDEIIEGLFLFIEKHNNRSINHDEKAKIAHSFISFIIDNNNGNEYSEFISAFIVSKKGDGRFIEQLATIKEGVVLYSGIKYNNNINDLGTWKTDMTIFIETEILFHFAGYNGEVYQRLWQDFYNFVREINNKKANRIKLKYFHDVNDEIERFFKKAEHIVEGKEKVNPKVTAMMSIIQGCETRADVVSKKAELFQNLKTSGIFEDDFSDYFDEKYHEYNIIDQTIIDSIQEKLNIDNPADYLKFLNFVSIQRKEKKEENFENVGFILLSGNYKTMQIAWHEDIKEYSYVPLATSLSFLTNKFWFKLNKGFGGDNFPINFDVITKAQIVLSNQLNESVGKKFEEFQEKFKNGLISEDQAKAAIIELRRQAKKPEDIREEEIDSILDLISEESIETFLLQQEHFKVKAQDESLKNIKLETELANKNQEVRSSRETQIDLSSKLITTKEGQLNDKQNSIDILTKQNTQIEKKIQIRKFWNNVMLVSIVIIMFSISLIIIWKMGWNSAEPWTWIISCLPIVVSLIYMIFTEKSINLKVALKKRNEKIKINQYKKYEFDIRIFEQLKQDKKSLEEEVQQLKNAHSESYLIS